MNKEVKPNIILSREQENAKQKIEQAIDAGKNILLIGSAGTGKTTVISGLKGRKQYAAPTHKACEVIHKMKESGSNVNTLDSMLKMRVRWKDGKETRYQTGQEPEIDGDYIVVDEISMCDLDLLKPLFETAAAYEISVIGVGDNCQLPPVNCEEPPAFSAFPETVKLTEVRRQAADNPIIAHATALRDLIEGRSQDFPCIKEAWGGGVGIKRTDKGDLQLARWIAKRFIAGHVCKFIGFTNARVNLMNKMVLDALDMDEFEPGLAYVSNNTVLGMTDGIIDDEIIIRNNQEVKIESADYMMMPKRSTQFSTKVCNAMNADIGEAPQIGGRIIYTELGDFFQPMEAEAINEYRKRLYRRAKDSMHARRELDRLKTFSDLRPPFATTVHKSQGSTYDYTILDLVDLNRCRNDKTYLRLLYTALTRASKGVVLSGKSKWEY